MRKLVLYIRSLSQDIDPSSMTIQTLLKWHLNTEYFLSHDNNCFTPLITEILPYIRIANIEAFLNTNVDTFLKSMGDIT